MRISRFFLPVIALALAACSTNARTADEGEHGARIDPSLETRRITGLGVNAGFYPRLLNNGGRVFREGYRTSEWQPGDEPFNPEFLELFVPFQAIRYHQTHEVSFSTEREWEDRAQPTVDLPITESDLASWSTEGVVVPYEWEVRLCNATSTDLWLALPHMASYDYLVSLAGLIRDSLNPELDVYVEYTNEIWNNFYADGGAWDPTPRVADGQYTYALERGLAEFGSLFPADAWEWVPISYWYVHASVQAWHAFESVLGDRRVHRVISWLIPEAAENWNSMEYVLDALERDEVNRVGDTVVSLRPEVFAVTSYFNGPWVDDEPSPNADWDDYRASIRALEENITFTRSILDGRGYADASLTSYEGGQHITNPDWDPVGTNRSPEMYDIYREWLAVTDEHLALTMHYSLVTPYGFGEAFGLKESIDQPVEEAHKWRAVLDHVGLRGGD